MLLAVWHSAYFLGHTIGHNVFFVKYKIDNFLYFAKIQLFPKISDKKYNFSLKFTW